MTRRMRPSALLDGLQQPLGLTSSLTTTLAWPTTRGSDPTAAASRVCARDGEGTRVPCQTRRHSHPHPHRLCPAPTRCRPPIPSLRLSQTLSRQTRSDRHHGTHPQRPGRYSRDPLVPFRGHPVAERSSPYSKPCPRPKYPVRPWAYPPGEGADNAPGLLQAFSPITGDPANAGRSRCRLSHGVGSSDPAALPARTPTAGSAPCQPSTSPDFPSPAPRFSSSPA